MKERLAFNQSILMQNTENYYARTQENSNLLDCSVVSMKTHAFP